MTAVDSFEGIHETLRCEPLAGHPAPRIQHSADIHSQKAADGRQAQQNASPVEGNTSAERTGHSVLHLDSFDGWPYP
jgi:hypothetical protein